VENRFQSLPFKRDLQRYKVGDDTTMIQTKEEFVSTIVTLLAFAVGLCTLNQVDT
jgi:hypothetical protein